MKAISKALSRGAIATVVAGAMVMGSATPAFAQGRGGHRDHDGISAGEVIAGAVILGGLAAVIASSRNNDRDYHYDNRGDRYDQRYDRGGYSRHNGYSSRAAVEECVRAAERRAQRYTGANAEVYEVTDIDRSRRGFEVRGRIAVRNDYRGRGWGGDYRRNYHQNAGWDEGRFTCDWRNGRVTDIDYRGIRNL